MTAHNKFGVHYVVDGSHDGYGADLERSAATGQPFGLVKSFFDKGALGQAKSVSKNTYTIYRASIDDQDFPPTENGSWYWPNATACKQSAIDWIAACSKLWKGEEANVDAYEFINEPNPTDEKIYWFIEWSRYCLDEAERLGYRLAWGGFSTGTPSESQMREMLPFVGELALRGHILTMHDGAVVEPFTFKGTATDPNSNNANSSLRYRWWKRIADEAGLPFPEVAITECYAYGKKIVPTFYDDWQWYLTELAKDDCLIGVAWYTLGNGGDFGNIAGKPMQFVVDRSLAIDYSAIEPPPPPPPQETQLVLKVPFTSQVGATTKNACGPACCAIMEGYLFPTTAHTTQEWYEATGAGTGLITIAQLQHAAETFGYTLRRLDNQSLDTLRQTLSQKIAPTLLVNAYYLDGCATDEAHFIVPVGYEFDGSAFYVHDPYTVNGKGGAFVRQTNIAGAWGNCHLQENPDYTMLVLEKGVTNEGWYPSAIKRPLDYHNYWNNIEPVKAAVIHIAEGPMSAIFNTFNVPNGQSSSHFAISKTGVVEQYVSIKDAAWCNGLSWSFYDGAWGWKNPRGIPVHPTWTGIVDGVNPNLMTISIEHEGFSGELWTPEMLDADAKLLQWLETQVGLRWQADITLIGHNAIDPVDRANDPGTGITMQSIVDATYPPMPSTALSGVGMGKPQLITPTELSAIAISKCNAVKLLTTGDPDTDAENYNAVKSHPFVMARLFFKPDFENKTPFPPDVFWNTVRSCALRLYSLGLLYFEAGNESNWMTEGFGWQWRNGEEFATWFNEVYLLMRHDMPNAKIGFPGVSPQVDDIPDVCQAAIPFLQQAASAVQSADFLCIHNYWDNSGTGHWGEFSEDFGGLWHRVVQRMFPTKTMIITEFSNNNKNVSYTEKGNQYKQYFPVLSGVHSAFAFALSWNDEDPTRECWVANNLITQTPIILGS